METSLLRQSENNIRKFYKMIYWITGQACSGKTKLIKSILNNYVDFPNTYEIYKPVKEISCIKFKDFLLVGSNYLRNKARSLGIDNSRGSLSELELLIKQEYSKCDILLETFRPKYFNIDFILRLKKMYDLKIFYLQTDKEILDERGRTRNHIWDRERTEKKKYIQMKKIESVIENDEVKSCVIKLENNNENDLSTNVKLILGSLS